MAGCPPPAVSYVGADGEQKEVQLFLGPAPGSFLMWSGDGVPQAELQVGEFEGCHYFSDITVAHAFQVACTGDKLYTFSVRDEGNCDAWVEAIQASAGASNGATPTRWARRRRRLPTTRCLRRGPRASATSQAKAASTTAARGRRLPPSATWTRT
jgi:hypothetical protein